VERCEALDLAIGEYRRLVNPRTGAVTWPLLFDRTALELLRARRTNRQVALLVFPPPRRRDGRPLDVVALAELIGSRMRPEDSLGCTSDGRFALLLGGLRDAEDAERVAQRIGQAVESYEMPLTVTVGGASDTPEGLFARALAPLTINAVTSDD
jgi:hypothetical protein